MTVTHVTAWISPKPGKEGRIRELVDAVVKGTHAEEPDATKFYVTKDVNSNDIIIIETYQSMAAFDNHKSKGYFQDFAKAVEAEDLCAKPPSIIASEGLTGFESR